MKVLSLLQPWATLVVLGHKKIETRSWKTEYQGTLLIHASKGLGKEQKALCKAPFFADALKEVDELPLGSIIGKINLLGVFSFDMPLIREAIEDNRSVHIGGRNVAFTPKEISFGSYSPGRWGWQMESPVQFKKPIPCRGSLSLWDFDERICLQCGCSENDACMHGKLGPCWWHKRELCSHCYFIGNGEVKVEDVSRSSHVPFF